MLFVLALLLAKTWWHRLLGHVARILAESQAKKALKLMFAVGRTLNRIVRPEDFLICSQRKSGRQW